MRSASFPRLSVAVLPSDDLELIPSKCAAARAFPPELPLYVEPAPEEALISWLLRLAAQLNISMQVLAQHAFQIPARADYSHWWRRASPELLQQISHRTSIRVERLRCMTFNAWAPVIHEDESSERLSGLRLADRPLRRTHRLAVCARCLAEDSRPYLRLSWMIGWMAVCPRHQTRLLTACPGCQVSLRLPPPAWTRAFCPSCCHRCGIALIHFDSPQAHPWVLRLQALLLAAKRDGLTELEGIGRLSWPQLLTLADILSELVWTAIGSSERKSLLRRVGYQMNTPLIQTPRNWNDRYGSLALLAGLLEGWPHSPTAHVTRDWLTRWSARTNGAFYQLTGPYLPRRSPNGNIPASAASGHPSLALQRQGWSLDERVRALLRLLGDTPIRAHEPGAHLIKPSRQPLRTLNARIMQPARYQRARFTN
jgi:hypothetical protein